MPDSQELNAQAQALAAIATETERLVRLRAEAVAVERDALTVARDRATIAPAGPIGGPPVELGGRGIPGASGYAPIGRGGAGDGTDADTASGGGSSRSGSLVRRSQDQRFLRTEEYLGAHCQKVKIPNPRNPRALVDGDSMEAWSCPGELFGVAEDVIFLIGEPGQTRGARAGESSGGPNPYTGPPPIRGNQYAYNPYKRLFESGPNHAGGHLGLSVGPEPPTAAPPGVSSADVATIAREVGREVGSAVERAQRDGARDIGRELARVQREGDQRLAQTVQQIERGRGSGLDFRGEGLD
jgi:hypothetical protein